MVNIGISEEAVLNSARLLRGLHASHFTLMLTAWGCHWNVVGKGFHSVHNYLKDLYEAEQDRVDELAERLRALGALPSYTMEQMLQQNQLKEMPDSMTWAPENVWVQMRESWEAMIRLIHDTHALINDQDFATKSLLEGMVEEMEKEAWMIRSYTE